MRRLFLILMLLLPASIIVKAQDAEQVLDKAINKIKADAGVQMNFSYTVFDDENNEVHKDKGVLAIDNDRYSLLLETVMVWCDGTTQWNYMQRTDELYITDADSEDAQNFSPLYIMELYKEGYDASIEKRGDENILTLAASEADLYEIVLTLDAKTNVPRSMMLYTETEGYTEVFLDNYQAKRVFTETQFICPLSKFENGDTEIVDMRE